MKQSCCSMQTDKGGNPYITNIEHITAQNPNFRTAIWTGCYLQMTVMCIPPCGEIGVEMHADTDQLIRIEHGKALVKMGNCRNVLDFKQNLCKGDAIFIPAGTWHNIVNASMHPLKLSSVYAPPNHPKGTVHKTRADGEKKKY